MKSNRGFTLIEIMISGGIMMIAVIATCMMLLEGQRFTRNTEEVAKSNDSARLAGEFIVGALRTAGMGANLGVYVNNGGVPRLNSQICQSVVVAGFTKSGGSAALVQGGTGQLQVNCTLGLLPGGIAPPPML